MNDGRDYPPQAGGLPEPVRTCVPRMSSAGYVPEIKTAPALFPHRRVNGRANGKREPLIAKDSLFTVWRDGAFHIIAENYSYKTEPYYSILRHELDGKPVQPSSCAVLDASVVPICLERASLAGIPVCDWAISQGYAPFPSILYGLNYYASTADYCVVRDNEEAKDVIRHITNRGKYPFCYQKLDDSATVHSRISVFGRTVGKSDGVARLAEMVYALFAIPLVTLVLVNSGGQYLLSSLSPTRYSQLSGEERSLLSLYLEQQEFL